MGLKSGPYRRQEQTCRPASIACLMPETFEHGKLSMLGLRPGQGENEDRRAHRQGRRTPIRSARPGIFAVGRSAAVDRRDGSRLNVHEREGAWAGSASLRAPQRASWSQAAVDIDEHQLANTIGLAFEQTAEALAASARSLGGCRVAVFQKAVGSQRSKNRHTIAGPERKVGSSSPGLGECDIRRSSTLAIEERGALDPGATMPVTACRIARAPAHRLSQRRPSFSSRR